MVAAAVKHERNLLLLSAWARAACYQRRTDWIEALLTRSHSILARHQVQRLLQALPADANDFTAQFFTQLLTADNFSDRIHQTLQIILDCDLNWSDRISNLVVQQFHKYIQQPDSVRMYYYQQNHSNVLGQYLDVSVLPDLQKMQSELTVDKFSYSHCIELLAFRRDMRSAFNTA